MANHAESFQFNARFVWCYPCLLPRDSNLLFHGVHAFEVRQQQPAAMPLAHDHAVFLRVELSRRTDGFGREQYINRVRKIVEFVLLHGIETRIAAAGRNSVRDDLLRDRITRGSDGADAAAQITVFME